MIELLAASDPPLASFRAAKMQRRNHAIQISIQARQQQKKDEFLQQQNSSFFVCCLQKKKKSLKMPRFIIAPPSSFILFCGSKQMSKK